LIELSYLPVGRSASRPCRDGWVFTTLHISSIDFIF